MDAADDVTTEPDAAGVYSGGWGCDTSSSGPASGVALTALALAALTRRRRS